MQILALKKLLQLIKNEIPSEEKLSEATLEQDRERSDENFELEIQNSELEEKTPDEKEQEDQDNTAPVTVENTRSHLTSSVPKSAKAPSGILTKGELKEIREIFKNLDDNEIQRLYKKVTK